MAGLYGKIEFNFFVFYESTKLFSKVGVQCYISTAMYESSSFSTSLLKLVIVCLFDCRHSNRYIVVSHCGLNLCFPND